MNLELIAFEIEGSAEIGNRSYRNSYIKLAEAIRRGDADAIEEVQTAGEYRRSNIYYHAMLSYGAWLRAKAFGFTTKPRDDYGSLRYFNEIEKRVVQVVDVDKQNQYKIIKMPNGEYVYSLKINYGTGGASIGGSVFDKGHPTMNETLVAMSEHALRQIPIRKDSKKIRNYYEELLKKLTQPVYSQLELF